MTGKNIVINLLFIEYQTPPIRFLYMLLAFFAFGFFIPCLFVFPKLLKYKKMIKHLNPDLRVQRDKTVNSGEK